MTTATAPLWSERPQVGTIVTIARKELRTALHSRWFWLWTAAFVGLAALLVTVALPDTGITGYAGFGRTSASLVTLVQIIVPLMGLTLGAQSIAGQRESGALRFLLSHPVSRTETFWGTFGGLAAALAIAVAGGFGVAGLLTTMRGVQAQPATLLWIALLAWLLAVAMLGVGMLISTFTSTSSAALGTAIFFWLVFVFLGDLGLMGTSAATQMPVNVLFLSALANPIEAFRLAALATFSGSLDVLGPAGSYAIDTLGDALLPAFLITLVLWIAVPATLAWVRFRTRNDL